MSVYFLDASALAKRYIEETGSAWVRGLCRPDDGHILLVARISRVEVASAFARRQREGTLSQVEVDQTVDDLRIDFDTQYQVVELSEELAEEAAWLVQRHPLRAYDAVQLASALYLASALPALSTPSFIFLSADARLLTVAKAEGVATDNPVNHP